MSDLWPSLPSALCVCGHVEDEHGPECLAVEEIDASHVPCDCIMFEWAGHADE